MLDLNGFAVLIKHEDRILGFRIDPVEMDGAVIDFRIESP